MKRNQNLAALQGNYLFPEINRYKQEFLSKNPTASLINLGIGDTTQPLPFCVVDALVHFSLGLGTVDHYTGYGPEQGHLLLREKIAKTFYTNPLTTLIEADEIFISDGAKCDIGRLQLLFGANVSIAIQDPTYPVYLEGSLIQGVKKIALMPCLPENDFFPDLTCLPDIDLLYFCSPNNPTGAVTTHEQLTHLVNFAKNRGALLIFDAAYAHYIQDPSLPRSIYEIVGAQEVAIEINSFSKLIGFTGVRLGWTVVPKALVDEEGHSIHADWKRLISTLFNGASNLAQAGGLAALEPSGLQAISNLTKFYLENAAILKEAFRNLGYTVFGGDHAPYLWVKTQQFDLHADSSWDTFHYFLQKFHLVTVPGLGFGKSGEGFIRLSSFNQRSQILESATRLNKLIN